MNDHSTNILKFLQSDSVIFVTFFVIFFILMMMPLIGILYNERRNQSYSNTNIILANKKKSHPVLGYKRSIMVFDSVDKKNNVINIHFKGVSGHGKNYGMIATRAIHTPGFYMYNTKNISKAKNHEQWGNVMLEVLGYGEIEEYDKGYIVEKQKVLQIIIDRDNIREDPYIIEFLIRNRLRLKDLYNKNWTDSDGNEIIFSPYENYSYSSRMKKYTIPAYSPTVLNNNKSLVESS